MSIIDTMNASRELFNRPIVSLENRLLLVEHLISVRITDLQAINKELENLYRIRERLTQERLTGGDNNELVES